MYMLKHTFYEITDDRTFGLGLYGVSGGGDSCHGQGKEDLAGLCVCRLDPDGYQPTG